MNHAGKCPWSAVETLARVDLERELVRGLRCCGRVHGRDIRILILSPRSRGDQRPVTIVLHMLGNVAISCKWMGLNMCIWWQEQVR